MSKKYIQLLPAMLIVFVVVFASEASAQQVFSFGEDRLQRIAERRLDDVSDLFSPWKHMGRIEIDSISVCTAEEQVQLFFSPAVTHIPIRYHWLQYVENELMNMLGRRFRHYQPVLFARGQHLYTYIPNFFRDQHLYHDSLRVRSRDETAPLVQRSSQPFFEHGLSNNHIAVWHSHGYYYDAANERWQWQRARLFSTIEDMLTMETVVHYLAPMLERSGANVLIPRERDIQINEVVVDIQRSSGLSELLVHNGQHKWDTIPGGFALRDTLFDGENPFEMGLHLRISANSGGRIEYIPDIPEDGHYAVYVSWAETPGGINDARYIVDYAGGSAGFRVNQQMGYGTWIFLGHFYFKQGINSENGRVVLFTDSAQEGFVTTDAVRFGGGMGNIARRASGVDIPNRQSSNDRGSSIIDQTGFSAATDQSLWKLSESPRFIEGARYYLQYAGMPDTLVYSLNEGKNDYNDDFMSRGEWVNYLLGTPLGPERNRNAAGLRIPVDLSLSFHTDAGVTLNDSVIGTLAIYSAQRDGGLFPDGISRLAGRDLSDIIQDQLVSDIQAVVNSRWTRRALWDRQYSEAWRPNVPAMLLELYSHQNLADIKYGLDPRFQFITARAIYKGILRYLAHNEGREAVIQPLPPGQLAIRVIEGKTIRLSWQAVEDPLEPSAYADYFIVYQREEAQGFNQGVTSGKNHIDIELPAWGKIYSFKVTAVNSGGESFPSEILSVAIQPDQKKTVLIVNGFDRISGPGIFETEQLAGLTWWDDLAIPYRYSVSTTGMQYDFNRQSPWLDDDSPGWGASYGDMEKNVIPGNSFDYPAMHGRSIRNAGYSFVSMSRQAFEKESFDINQYFAINMIMGKQKGIPAWLDKDSITFRLFTARMIEKLITHASNGGNILITGAHVGSDMIQFNDEDAQDFASNWLGYNWRTNNATNTGTVIPTKAAESLHLPNLFFNTGVDPHIYTVEAPDAIEANGENSIVAYRYGSNKTSAAVLHISSHKAFTFGFPFESIIEPAQRDELMKKILYMFENQ